MAGIGQMVAQFDEDVKQLLEHEFSFKDEQNQMILQPIEDFRQRVPRQIADAKEVPPELENWNDVSHSMVHGLAPRWPNDAREVQELVQERLQLLDNLF